MTTAKFEKLGHKYVSQFARESFRALIFFQFAKKQTKKKNCHKSRLRPSRSSLMPLNRTRTFWNRKMKHKTEFILRTYPKLSAPVHDGQLSYRFPSSINVKSYPNLREQHMFKIGSNKAAHIFPTFTRNTEQNRYGSPARATLWRRHKYFSLQSCRAREGSTGFHCRVTPRSL